MARPAPSLHENVCASPSPSGLQPFTKAHSPPGFPLTATAVPAADFSVNPYWRRNLYVCLFGSFTNMAGMTLMLPFLPNYIRDLGVKDNDGIVFWSAVAFSASFLAAATVSPIWGWLADLYGRKPMLIRACLGMTIAMSTMGMAHNVYELVALGRRRLPRRLHLGLRDPGREPDAEGSLGLGAGQIVDRLAVGQRCSGR